MIVAEFSLVLRGRGIVYRKKFGQRLITTAKIHSADGHLSIIENALKQAQSDSSKSDQ